MRHGLKNKYRRRTAPPRWCKDINAHPGHHWVNRDTGLIWWCKGTWS